MRWSRARKHGISRLNNKVGDIVYEWGEGCADRGASLLHYHFGVGHWNLLEKRSDQSLLEQLHARGYDLRTLKFSIKKRDDA